MKGKIDLVKLWIKKAENDLINAQNSIKIKPEPPLDTVCFHAQQCAEKYIKAFLVYHDVEFEKTHDLEKLAGLASKVDNSFFEIFEMCRKLTDYSVDIRYPLFEEPTKEETEEAIEIAEKIKKFVLEHLPLSETER